MVLAAGILTIVIDFPSINGNVTRQCPSITIFDLMFNLGAFRRCIYKYVRTSIRPSNLSLDPESSVLASRPHRLPGKLRTRYKPERGVSINSTVVHSVS